MGVRVGVGVCVLVIDTNGVIVIDGVIVGVIVGLGVVVLVTVGVGIALTITFPRNPKLLMDAPPNDEITGDILYYVNVTCDASTVKVAFAVFIIANE